MSHQSTEYLPKSLGDNHNIFWQMRDEPLCSFWSAVAFALEISHGRRFCPVYFLLNHGALGVILVGRPPLGRFATVPSFLHLWLMALAVFRWSPEALGRAL